MSTKTPAELLQDATAKLSAFNSDAMKQVQGVESRMGELEQHIAMMPTGGVRVSNGGPSLANSFANSDSFAAMQKGANSTGRIQLEAPMNAISNPDQGGTSLDTQSQRADGIFNDPRRSLSILDLLPKLKVETKTFEYLRLAGYSNDAAFQINEGDQKAESDMPTELIDAEICTIAHFVRASAQIIDDQPALAGQINNLLTYGVRAKLENSIISGPGTKGTIHGLAGQATAYSATATAAADKIGQAVVELNSNGWNASAILLNPVDWFAIASERADDSQYVLGSPRNPSPAALWNVPVATSPSMTKGSAMVLDVSQLALLDREAPVIMASRVDGDNMTRNLITILGELRAGLAVFSSGAVLSVDITPAA